MADYKDFYSPTERGSKENKNLHLLFHHEPSFKFLRPVSQELKSVLFNGGKGEDVCILHAAHTSSPYRHSQHPN